MYKEKLINALNNYESGKSNEEELQLSIESIASMISENSLYEFRQFLFEVVRDLELIIFTVNSDESREKCLQQIQLIRVNPMYKELF